jgi:DNA-binding CsgD family transcriptional regulator
MTLLSRVPLRGNQRAETDAGSRTSDPRLTPRQRQVLDGLIRGLSNKEIAAELGVGADAVKRVISRLLIKLNAPSRTALVQPALQTEAARLRRSRVPSALSLLDAAPIPALVTRGAAHRVEYANPVARSVLSGAAPGIELAALFPTEPRQTVVRIADASFAEATPRVARRVELRDPARVGGGWHCVDVFTTPIHDGMGKLAGLVVFLVDLSSNPIQMQASTPSEPSVKQQAQPA